MCWFMLIQKSCAFYWMDHNKDGKKDMSLSIIIFCPDPPPTLNISISYPTEPAAFPQPVSMHIPLLLNPRWLKPRLSKSPSEALAGLSSNDELHTCNVSWSKCQSVSTEPKAAGWGSACLQLLKERNINQKKNHIRERRLQRTDELKRVLQLLFILLYPDKTIISFWHRNKSTATTPWKNRHGCKSRLWNCLSWFKPTTV